MKPGDENMLEPAWPHFILWTVLVPGVQQSSDKDSGTVLVNKIEDGGLEKVR